MNSVRYASIYKEASRHLQTTPAAPAMVASRHLVDGRSHPSLTKEGSSPAPAVSRLKGADGRTDHPVCPSLHSAKTNTAAALPGFNSGATRSAELATSDGPVVTATYCF